MPKKLTQDERNQLADAYQDCRERDEGSSWRDGSHMILIHLLGLLGYNARSSEQAENTAERILYEGE